MLNITFKPKMPSPKACHMNLLLLIVLILAPAWVLLAHKHYEAARILTFLAAILIVALFLLGARGMLSTFTCTAISSNKPTKVSTDKATVETTSEVTRTALSTAISDPSLAWYTSLVFLSLASLANAMTMWLLSYSHEEIDGELHGVTEMLLVLALVVAGVGAVMNVMDQVRDFKLKKKRIDMEIKNKGMDGV
jgi:hypothetical protein